MKLTAADLKTEWDNISTEAKTKADVTVSTLSSFMQDVEDTYAGTGGAAISDYQVLLSGIQQLEMSVTPTGSGASQQFVNDIWASIASAGDTWLSAIDTAATGSAAPPLTAPDPTAIQTAAQDTTNDVTTESSFATESSAGQTGLEIVGMADKAYQAALLTGDAVQIGDAQRVVQLAYKAFMPASSLADVQAHLLAIDKQYATGPVLTAVDTSVNALQDATPSVASAAATGSFPSGAVPGGGVEAPPADISSLNGSSLWATLQGPEGKDYTVTKFSNGEYALYDSKKAYFNLYDSTGKDITNTLPGSVRGNIGDFTAANSRGHGTGWGGTGTGTVVLSDGTRIDLKGHDGMTIVSGDDIIHDDANGQHGAKDPAAVKAYLQSTAPNPINLGIQLSDGSFAYTNGFYKNAAGKNVQAWERTSTVHYTVPTDPLYFPGGGNDPNGSHWGGENDTALSDILNSTDPTSAMAAHPELFSDPAASSTAAFATDPDYYPAITGTDPQSVVAAATTGWTDDELGQPPPTQKQLAKTQVKAAFLEFVIPVVTSLLPGLDVAGLVGGAVSKGLVALLGDSFDYSTFVGRAAARAITAGGGDVGGPLVTGAVGKFASLDAPTLGRYVDYLGDISGSESKLKTGISQVATYLFGANASDFTVSTLLTKVSQLISALGGKTLTAAEQGTLTELQDLQTWLQQDLRLNGNGVSTFD